jgi:hypothetical protein
LVKTEIAVVENRSKENSLYQYKVDKKTPSLALRQNDGAGTEKRPKMNCSKNNSIEDVI